MCLLGVSAQNGYLFPNPKFTKFCITKAVFRSKHACLLTKSQSASLDFVANRFFMKLVLLYGPCLELVISRLSVNVDVILGFSCQVFCCPVVLIISCGNSHNGQLYVKPVPAGCTTCYLFLAVSDFVFCVLCYLCGE